MDLLAVVSEEHGVVVTTRNINTEYILKSRDPLWATVSSATHRSQTKLTIPVIAPTVNLITV